MFTSLLAFIIALQLFMSRSSRVFGIYTDYVFFPLQRFRSFLLNFTKVSIGDFLYLILLGLLLFFLIRTMYNFVRYRKNKSKILPSLLHLGNTALVIYLCFLLLWGGNYSRPNITAAWHTSTASQWDSSKLIQLNSFLVSQLNTIAGEDVRYVNDHTVNTTADHLYQKELGGKYDFLKIKPSTLGNALNYFGIQGYYNPLSGEGQFNNKLPDFMHPFVITHEMAHQAGIAAEDDANLMAYIICTKSDDNAFRYSGYFNVFLYAYSELKYTQPKIAAALFDKLNQKTRNDISLLKTLRTRYKSFLRGMSLGLYNQYLVWQGQEKGLDTYSDVTRWVYLWENGEKEKTDGKVCLY